MAEVNSVSELIELTLASVVTQKTKKMIFIFSVLALSFLFSSAFLVFSNPDEDKLPTIQYPVLPTGTVTPPGTTETPETLSNSPNQSGNGLGFLDGGTFTVHKANGITESQKILGNGLIEITLKIPKGATWVYTVQV